MILDKKLLEDNLLALHIFRGVFPLDFATIDPSTSHILYGRREDLVIYMLSMEDFRLFAREGTGRSVTIPHPSLDGFEGPEVRVALFKLRSFFANRFDTNLVSEFVLSSWFSDFSAHEMAIWMEEFGTHMSKLEGNRS